MAAIELTDQLMQSFKIAKVFRDNSQHVTSVDFDPTGDYCITASSDDTLNLYDSVGGRRAQTIPSKGHGAALARFAMHRPGQVVHASSKGEDTLRLLSLQERTYLRCFRGHQQRVVALEASPLNQQFLSAAANDTIRLWDLRSSTCQAQKDVLTNPLVAFDPQGMVFAVGIDSRFIRLYDCRGYERGPFGAFEIVDDAEQHSAGGGSLDASGSLTWCSLKFSPDGRDLLINTVEGDILLLDSFDCYVKRVLLGRPQNTTQLGMEASWTADAQYVVAGAMDGSLYTWSRSTGELVAQADGHPTYPLVCRFNPRKAMMVSACTNVAFWLPEL